MIEIRIPGFGHLRLRHLVLDYNGTLAHDGKLLHGVDVLLTTLAKTIQIHVVTADTFGVAANYLARLPVKLTIAPPKSQAAAKLAYIKRLGAANVVAVGNGRNDRRLLKAAALGIALIQKEGGATATVASSDVLATNILDALDLLLHPKRLIATLRS